MGLAILGSGSALPHAVLKSAELLERYGADAAKLAARSGVHSRYYCTNESQIDLACQAARQAIEKAKITPRDIDLVISGCAIPYQTLPATAPLVMARLGMADGACAAFDVNSTCLSFLSGLDVANGLINAGQYKTALVFASEVASRALPWRDDPETAALFGDGAGAVVVQNSTDNVGQRASLMRTYPSAYDACTIGAGGTRIDFHNDPQTFAANATFQMNGKELFRISTRHFSGFVDDLLAQAGWRQEDVDLIIPHQASPFGLAHMIRQVGVPAEKVVNIASEFGNQIAASIPFTLNYARQQGRIPKGTKILFLGTSAGVSIGGAAWQI